MTNTYESIYICPAELAHDKIESSLEKVKSVITRAEGKIVTAELWGRRRLAYPIRRSREGFYVYLIFTASSGAPALLDRHYQVSENILRGLTVKVDPRHLEKIRHREHPAEPAHAPAQALENQGAEKLPPAPAPVVENAGVPAPTPETGRGAN